MGPGDEGSEQGSAAFGGWQAVERDLRAFLRVGLRFAGDAYERLWAEAAIGAGDGHDRIDAFEELIDGVWQHDFAWMHEQAILGEAVVNYEVYVERAHAELLRRAHERPSAASPPPGTEEASAALVDALAEPPAWDELTRFFARLDVDVEPPPVLRVRQLRRLLAHRRGALRTEHLRQRFETRGEPLAAAAVALDEHDVIEAMDALARAVQAADAVVRAHSAGRRPFPDWS